jgi:hypothetical protein
MPKIDVLEYRRKAMLNAMAALKGAHDASREAEAKAPSTHAALVFGLSGAIITALDRELEARRDDDSFDMLDLVIAYPEANAIVLASMLRTMLAHDRVMPAALELAAAHKASLLRFATIQFPTAT